MSLSENTDPIDQFELWLADARKTDLREPTAVTLATVDSEGHPSARMVLLKHVDQRGFVFYTNLASPKAQQLDANPYAALCFYWHHQGRQVRVRGPVELVTDAEADAYFASRDRKSQIGAWASRQSAQLEGKLALEKRVAYFVAKFGVSKVPRPEFWSGYRVLPERIEFWLEKPFRLHDRLVYHRDGDAWRTEWLYP